MVNASDDSSVPEFCSPDIVRYLASSLAKVKISFGRFPISNSLIDEMPQFLGQVNLILAAGDVHGISSWDITLLQGLVRGNNTQEAMMHPIFLSLEQQLWLEFYLELRNPQPNPDDFVGPPTAEQVNAIMEESSEADIDATWEMVKRRAGI